jgi:hypothetical protein
MSIKIDTQRELEDIHLNLNQMLEERDKLFPIRDPQNTKNTREILIAYINALKSVKNPNWKPDSKLIELAKKIFENCVFICGYMKSGTTLLLELLDGHQELIVMPGDSRMIAWITKQSNMSWMEILQGWDTHWVSRLINPTGQKPFWIMGENETPYLDFLNYLTYWLENLPQSPRSPFLAAVLAFYCANSRRATTPKLWIEKTPGNELNVDQILNFFPSARFIHIIRDPRSNIASLKRLFKLRNWNWDTEAYAYSMRKSIETGFQNQERLGEDKYHILRYEDLVTNPEARIQDVARFLGIKMNKVILSPSVNGLPAKSNTMFEDRQIQGKILTTISDRWKTELDPQEQKMVWGILHSVANRLGYKWNVGFTKWAYFLYYYQIRFRHFLFRILSRAKKN